MKSAYRIIPLAALLISTVHAGTVQAQAPARMEFGALFSALRLEDFNAVNSGIGGRFSYDLTGWAAVDLEFRFFPQDSARLRSRGLSNSEFQLTYERRRSEALFGVKTGWRGERVGLFAKARPGITRLSHTGFDCDGEMCALILVAAPVYKTEPAIDLGGVVEFYPTARTVARFDVGDLLIRQRSSPAPCRNCVTNNFSSSAGISWRF
jgi:hypothetical protein